MKKLHLYFLLQIILLTCIQLQAQQWEWVKHIGGKGNDICSNMAMDSDKNIYALISTDDTLYIDNEILYNGNYIIKLDSSGHLIWKKPSNDAYNIAIDNFNNLYILGFFKDTTIIGSDTLIAPQLPYYYGNYFTYLAKYDSAFNPIWTKFIGIIISKDLKIVNNNVYISGYFAFIVCGNDTINPYYYQLSDDAIILKYSSEGNYLNNIHIYNYGEDGDCDECCSSLRYATMPFLHIAIDNHENVYTSIYISGEAGIGIQGAFFSTPSCSIYKYIVCKFDSSFSYKYGYAGNVGYDLTVQNNQFYIFDKTYSSLTYNGNTVPLDSINLLLVKVNNSNGMIENFSHYKLDTAALANNSTCPVIGNNVILNNLTFLTTLPNKFMIDNDTLISYFYNSIQFSRFYPTYYLLKYDTNLKIIKHVHVLDMDSTFHYYSYQTISAISFQNNYYIANNFLTNIFLCHSVYSSNGGYDIIIGKLVDNTNNVPNLPYKTSFFTVFPNPTTGIFTVSCSDNSLTFTAEVSDFLCRSIFTANSVNGKVQFDLSSHPKGIYIVKSTTSDGKVYVGKIVYQ
jgi:hypothetical protein